jgi:Flp pilus assembly protein TadB
VAGKYREPLRPPPWAPRMSGSTPVRWFFRASAAIYALMLVVAVMHHWWWLVAVGFLGGTSSLLGLLNLKRKATRNQPPSD